MGRSLQLSAHKHDPLWLSENFQYNTQGYQIFESMLTKVFTDSWKVNHRFDAVALKNILITNAGKLQQRRGLEGSGRNNDVLFHPFDCELIPVSNKIDAKRALAPCRARLE